MIHLKIEQNGITEEVTSSVISKLYEITSTSTLDNTSDLKGRLHSTTGYENLISYLNTNFPDLYINVDKSYIKFLDAAAQQWCVTNFSTDGVGCSVSDLAAVVDDDIYASSSFMNSGIVYFNEFLYFTGITQVNLVTSNAQNNNTTLKQITLPNTVTKIGRTNYGGGFYGYSALESIHIPSNCTLNLAVFRYCTSLKSVSFGTGVTFNSDDQFSNCTSLTTVDLSGLTKIPASIFDTCTSLTSIFIPNTITEINYGFVASTGVTSITFEEGGTDPLVLIGSTNGYAPGVFRMISSLKIIFPQRLSELKNSALACTNDMTYVFTSTTPPSVTGDGTLGSVLKNSKIYVPNSAVNTYKAATGFSDYANVIFPVSELPS